MSQEAREKLTLELLTRFRMYTSFGVAVIVANLIVVVVHVSNKDMNKRYILFTLLSVAELVNGVSFIAAGVGREIQIHMGTYFTPVKVSECLMWFPWPTLLLFAGQLPAMLNLMLAVERVIAVQCSGWYRNVWTWKHKALLGAFGYFVCIVGYVLALLSSHFSHQINLTRICAVMEATGIIYGSLHYAFISLAYLISFIVVLIIFMITRANKSAHTIRVPASEDSLRRHRRLRRLCLLSKLYPHLQRVAHSQRRSAICWSGLLSVRSFEHFQSFHLHCVQKGFPSAASNVALYQESKRGECAFKKQLRYGNEGHNDHFANLK